MTYFHIAYQFKFPNMDKFFKLSIGYILYAENLESACTLLNLTKLTELQGKHSLKNQLNNQCFKGLLVNLQHHVCCMYL